MLLLISSAIAEAFTVNGAKVYITGRRKETLERTAAEINGVAGNDGGVCIPSVRPSQCGTSLKDDQAQGRCVGQEELREHHQ